MRRREQAWKPAENTCEDGDRRRLFGRDVEDLPPLRSVRAGVCGARDADVMRGRCAMCDVMRGRGRTKVQSQHGAGLGQQRPNSSSHDVCARLSRPRGLHRF